MAKKIVGITCSTQEADEKSGARQYLNQAYVRAIEQAGGIPVILPVTTEPDAIARFLSVVDGILLSGGVDVSPSVYKASPHPKLGSVDADRDATEIPLIQEALVHDVPIFAICRGIQTLNVAMGGTLFQHLPDEHPSPIEHQQGNRGMARHEFVHDIEIESGSRLHKIIGAESMNVNSFHHQAVQTLAEGLTITARASDGIIEAAESQQHRYVVAVQFHPEETAPRDEKSRRLFQAFVDAL